MKDTAVTLFWLFSGLYETPGGQILLVAHTDIEIFTMDRVNIYFILFTSVI